MHNEIDLHAIDLQKDLTTMYLRRKVLISQRSFCMNNKMFTINYFIVLLLYILGTTPLFVQTYCIHHCSKYLYFGTDVWLWFMLETFYGFREHNLSIIRVRHNAMTVDAEQNMQLLCLQNCNAWSNIFPKYQYLSWLSFL